MNGPSSTETKRLKITEIFHSIQGESTLTGERFSFIRTTGCPLRCTYCDTTYSYTGGQWMSIPEILKTIEPHKTKWVCLTGGEPLAQKTSLDLVRALHDKNYQITIETDGDEDISAYVPYARIIMDIKTPGSGETDTIWKSNLKHLQKKDEIKFVLCGREDYLWARAIVQEHALNETCTVLFSHVFKEGGLKDLASWIIEDNLNVRLQTQLHKHIWGTEERGV